MLSISTFLLGSGLPVPVKDPVYFFLRRMETRQVIVGLNDAALPLSRDEIAGFLLKIQKNADRLSFTDRKLLDEFMADYRLELQPKTSENETFSAPFYQKDYFRRFPQNLLSRADNLEENHLLSYEQGNTFVWFDLGVRIRYDWKNNHQKHLVSDKYMLRGALGKQLTYHITFSRFLKKYNPAFSEPYAEEVGNWSMFQPDSSVSFDRIESSFVYHNDLFDIGLYRQQVLWGTSFANNLILSNNSPLFSYIGFQTKLKGIRLSFIHGSLMNDSTRYRDIPASERNRSKFIAAHRIDIPLFKKTTSVSFSDIVVYGDRNMELSYMMPFNFFWATGHSLEDRDNELMAIDFKTTIIKNVTFYGSILIDEMRFSELGKHWWANKHALQAGARYSTNIGAFPVDLQAEFTAVRPWTYTHKTLTTDYTQNGICLGFPYGPNSQAWFFRGATYLSRRTQIECQFINLKHGVDVPKDTLFWGGDPTVSYELRDTTFDNSTKWLMGDIDTSNRLKIGFRYELFNDIFIECGLETVGSQLNGIKKRNRFGYIELEINY